MAVRRVERVHAHKGAGLEVDARAVGLRVPAEEVEFHVVALGVLDDALVAVAVAEVAVGVVSHAGDRARRVGDVGDERRRVRVGERQRDRHGRIVDHAAVRVRGEGHGAHLRIDGVEDQLLDGPSVGSRHVHGVGRVEHERLAGVVHGAVAVADAPAGEGVAVRRLGGARHEQFGAVGVDAAVEQFERLLVLVAFDHLARARIVVQAVRAEVLPVQDELRVALHRFAECVQLLGAVGQHLVPAGVAVGVDDGRVTLVDVLDRGVGLVGGVVGAALRGLAAHPFVGIAVVRAVLHGVEPRAVHVLLEAARDGGVLLDGVAVVRLPEPERLPVGELATIRVDLDQVPFRLPSGEELQVVCRHTLV